MVKLNKTLKGLIYSAILFVLISHFIKFYPAEITVDIGRTNVKVLTLYYDTGTGYSESERDFEWLNGGGRRIDFVLPKRLLLKKVRVDLDGPISQKARTVDINSLCLKTLFRSKCWQANEIKEGMMDAQNISLAVARDDVLFIEAQGADPHFSLKLDIDKSHLRLAKMGKIDHIFLTLLCLILSIFAYKVAWPFCRTRYRAVQKQDFSFGVGTAISLVALLSIFLSGLWFIIYLQGMLLCIVVAVLLICMPVIAGQDRINPRRYWQRTKDDVISGVNVSSLLMLVLILLPTSYLMASTWSQDFPHLGDHEYHFWGNQIAYKIDLEYLPLILITSILFVLAYLLGYLSYYVIAASVLIIFSGFFNEVNTVSLSDMQGVIARYPAGARLLAAPFVAISEAFNWHSPLNTGRMVNYLSLPIYLLILRPLIIGRTPNLALLPLFIFVFFQTEIVYFITSAYLDVWCFIFVLLATEKLILGEGDKAYLKACLLLGVACAFKEPAVFLIPFFWLSATPKLWIKLKQGDWRDIRQAVVVGFASVLPFILYYIERKQAGVNRYTFKGFEYFLTEPWFDEISNRLVFHFGVSGVVVLALVLILWSVCLFSQRYRGYRFMMLCLFVAFICQIFLFNLDQGGIAWTGYFRFYLEAFAVFSAPLFLISRDFSNKPNSKSFKVMLLISCIALAGNLPRLVSYLSLTTQSDAARNFTEHYDAPIFLPIRSLIEQGEADGALHRRQTGKIHINYVTGWNQPNYAYTALVKEYYLDVSKQWVCSCSESNKTILAPFVYLTGLNQSIAKVAVEQVEEKPQRVMGYVKFWEKNNARRPQCLADLKQSCSYYIEEKVGDEVVGALGVF